MSQDAYLKRLIDFNVPKHDLSEILPILDIFPVAAFIYKDDKCLFLNKSAELYFKDELNELILSSLKSHSSDFSSFIEHRLGHLSIKATSFKLKTKTYTLVIIEIKNTQETFQVNPSHFLQILSNMSHELRTPMNSVIGFSRLLKETELNMTQKDFVDKINIASDHLLTLLNDLIDYTRIETGNMKLESKPFRFSQVLHDVKSMVFDSINQKGLYFDLDIDSTPEMIIGDQVRLKQILINLISNAVKFTESGGISIASKIIEKINDQEMMISILIKDTGIGMTEEQLEHIFNAFDQASESSYRRFGGSGLGLAISQRLAKLMNGEIHVTSTWNEGSEFTLVLPIQLWKQEPSFQSMDRYSTEGKPQKGSKILVADDNLISLKLTERILTNLGMKVTLAEDGQQALDFMLKETFDLVMLDLKMPNKSGIEVARIIRMTNKELPILALTAHTFSEDRMACLNAGMNGYIQKPIDQKSLYQALSVWIKEK